MTNSSRKKFLFLLAAALPALALAQTQPQQPSRPAGQPQRPVYRAPSSAQQDWQRAVDRSRVQSQQRQNAVQQQLQQDNVNRQMNATTDPALRSQLDNANRTQQNLYRSKQDDEVKRYNDRHPGQPPPPAGTSSTGR
ncbi:hypothetical protein [Luteibacter sp. CQ10]|uniref:hypothetical protein n=1 Tax=Luteibacter sp. CQ10 TaxID=2805821 RepID=UPI0034A40114